MKYLLFVLLFLSFELIAQKVEVSIWVDADFENCEVIVDGEQIDLLHTTTPKNRRFEINSGSHSIMIINEEREFIKKYVNIQENCTLVFAGEPRQHNFTTKINQPPGPKTVQLEVFWTMGECSFSEIIEVETILLNEPGLYETILWNAVYDKLGNNFYINKKQ